MERRKKKKTTMKVVSSFNLEIYIYVNSIVLPAIAKYFTPVWKNVLFINKNRKLTIFEINSIKVYKQKISTNHFFFTRKKNLWVKLIQKKIILKKSIHWTILNLIDEWKKKILFSMWEKNCVKSKKNVCLKKVYIVNSEWLKNRLAWSSHFGEMISLECVAMIRFL